MHRQISSAPPTRAPLFAALAATLTLLVLILRIAHADDLQIRLTTPTPSIAMGHTVAVTATAARGAAPAGGIELWAYRNGARWGAPSHTDAHGLATFLLPMPDAGTAEIQVAPAPPGGLPAILGAPPGPEKWVWASATKDGQTVYFQRAFEVRGAVTRAALLLAADDNCDAYVNGALIVSGAPFTGTSASDITSRLKPGRNVMTVTARNGAFQAGLLVRLEWHDASGAQTILSDNGWRVYAAKPAGWPQPVPDAGATPATVIASLGGAPWPNNPRGWPGMGATRYFPVGRSMASLVAGAVKSNVLRIVVRRVTPTPLFDDEAHQVGMAYSNWFTPQNAHWDQAEAVPVLGQYSSDDTAVLRQHLLWMDAMGINFLYLDWSNTLWGKAHWSERFPGADDLMVATGHLLDTMAAMRAEGIPTPRLTLLLGQYNGETAQPAALDEEMQAVYDTLVAPAKYRGLWESYGGKPLMLIFETQGSAFLSGQTPLKQTHFAVRYVSTQLQKNSHAKEGFWSWMDGTVHPVPTPLPGGATGAEALTVTPAFFGNGGWTYPEAVGRSAGATYIEEFKTALAVHPRFLLMNQWNEFVGPVNGNGGGPNHDQYYDTYTPELSNDIEPTSWTESGYRGGVGWGFTYLNLTRALLQVYHGQAADSTIITIAVFAPAAGAAPTGAIPVIWNAIGGKPATFAVLVDGVPVAQHLRSNAYQLPLSRLKPGRHKITVQAEGRVTRFPLSPTREDEPLSKPIPAAASLELDYAPTGRR